jgi:hypothetical protein
MTNSITPPPELLEHWENQHYEEGENYDVMLIQAYQAGADQELKACCEWLDERAVLNGATALRTARRPKPPSLKEQALAVLTQYMTGETILTKDSVDTIRRALEALDD